MLVYHGDGLAPIGYTDTDFQSDTDLRKSTSGYVLHWVEQLLVGGVSSNHVLLIQL